MGYPHFVLSLFVLESRLRNHFLLTRLSVLIIVNVKQVPRKNEGLSQKQTFLGVDSNISYIRIVSMYIFHLIALLYLLLPSLVNLLMGSLLTLFLACQLFKHVQFSSNPEHINPILSFKAPIFN